MSCAFDVPPAVAMAMSDIQQIMVLYSTMASCVCSGVLGATGQPVVFKCVRRNSSCLYEFARNETQVLQKLRKKYLQSESAKPPFFVPILGIVETQNCSLLVLEKADTDLLQHFLECKALVHPQARRKAAIHYVREVLFALSSLHAMHITHNDIKPENVVLFFPQHKDTDDELAHALQGRVALIDWGMSSTANPLHAKHVNATDDQGNVIIHHLSGKPFGTIAYMHPDVANGQAVNLYQGELYSVGIMLFSLFVGSSPFCNNSPTKHQKAIRQAFVNGTWVQSVHDQKNDVQFQDMSSLVSLLCSGQVLCIDQHILNHNLFTSQNSENHDPVMLKSNTQN